jgi:hypothetical protein
MKSERSIWPRDVLIVGFVVGLIVAVVRRNGSSGIAFFCGVGLLYRVITAWWCASRPLRSRWTPSEIARRSMSGTIRDGELDG